MAETQADIREYLLVHETLRRLLGRFSDATAKLTPARLAPVVGDRWALFARGLHHHHETEDNVFFPALVHAAPDTTALVERLESEHRTLVTALDAVDAAVGAFASQPDEQHQQRLHDAIERVRSELVPHLDVEDRDLLPRAAETIDPRAWKKMSDDAMKSVPKQDLPVVAGALDETARSLPPDQLPAPPPMVVRLLLALSWRKRYARFIEPLAI